MSGPQPAEGSYAYDTAGNVTNIVRENGFTLDLAWNSQYQLVSVATNGAFAESYSYDALGRRVSTTTLDGTIRHIYDDNWQCIADIDENNNVVCSYTWGEGIDNLLAVKVGDSAYYPLTDVQGTVWGYVDSENYIVARFDYDAWGNILASTSTIPALARNRYRFQGREWSAATGLTNFRMRWYDAMTGRWLSKDPIGLSGGLNLYAFCGDQPILDTDLYGLARDTIDGMNLEVHKCDQDPWPSKPHAHDLNNPNIKVSPDGTIWNKQNRKAIGKISKKALPKLTSLFARSLGVLSLFTSVTTMGDSQIYPGMLHPGPPSYLFPSLPACNRNPTILWLR